MKFHAISLALLINLALIVGCQDPDDFDGKDEELGQEREDDVGGQDGEGDMECLEEGVKDDGMSAWTNLMLYDWLQAQASRHACEIGADIAMVACLEDEGKDPQYCSGLYEQGYDDCREIHGKVINRLPMRVCDTVIENAGPGNVSYDDPDEDGIPNWWEFLMGLNPCTPYSSGCWATADADLDYDKDGLKNSEDPYPMCPEGGDPQEWDCI